MLLETIKMASRCRAKDNCVQKSGKSKNLRQTFVVSSVMIIFLFFINLTPHSYADVITTILVGTNPYGITYGTAYGNCNIYVAKFVSNNVSVISNTTNSVVATIPVGTSPSGIAYGNGNIYVTNYNSNTVSVISSTTNSVVATIPVGTNPTGIA